MTLAPSLLSLFSATALLLANPALANPAQTKPTPTNPAQSTQSQTTQKKRFDEILACHTQTTAPGMAIIASQGGKLLYRGARGLANAELNVPLTPDNIFHIGSVSKQFTAAAILLLAEQHKLTLDDNLHSYVPHWPTGDHQVTIRQLLSHTSGLADYTSNQQIMKTRLQESVSLDELLAIVADDPMLFAPGEKYSYSNTGYVLLGKIIEVASGQSYADFMQQQIFDKLGMKSTRIAGRQLINNRASGYTYSATGMMNDNRTEHYRNAMLIDMSWPHAAGAIASSPDDMVTWFTALKDGNLVSPASYRKMSTRARLNDGSPVNYGFGLDIGPLYKYQTISHQGSVPGFFTWSVYFPEKDLYVAALSNNDSLHPGPAALHIAGEILGAVPAFSPITPSRRQLSQLTGRYQLSPESYREISDDNGQLYSQRDGGPKEKIYPLAGDTQADMTLGFKCAPDYFKVMKNDRGQAEMLSYSAFSPEPQRALKL